MFMRFKSTITSMGTVRGSSGILRSTLSRLNATRLPSPTALTTISGWPEPSCTTSPAAKKFVSPMRPNASILIVPRSVLYSAGSQSSFALWPTAMMTLSTANFLAGASRSMAIGEALILPVKRAGCSCNASTLPSPRTAVMARPCISSTPSSSMSCRSSGEAGISWRLRFHRDHGHFDGALAERFARAVDGGVSAADDDDASAELHFGRAHADVAKEWKAEDHAGFVLAFGSRAVGFGKAHGEYGGVIILFQIVQRDVFADFDVGLDLNAEFDEALNFAIEHRLRQDPVRNAAAIESACLRRLLQDRHLVAEARQLVRGAVARGA